MKIVAASSIRDEEIFIESMIKSISWVDKIIILNDHSHDGTAKILAKIKKTSTTPIEIIKPFFSHPMIKYLSNGKRDLTLEMEARNLFLKYVFKKCQPDAVLLIDGDELMSSTLRPKIEEIVSNKKYNSIALSCYHVFDRKHYLEIYLNKWNQVKLIDPHVRVLTQLQKYQHGEWKDVPDCFLKPSPKTLCLNGPFHYHLKYLQKIGLDNYSFKFLPKKLNYENTKKYLKPYTHKFPEDIIGILDKYI